MNIFEAMTLAKEGDFNVAPRCWSKSHIYQHDYIYYESGFYYRGSPERDIEQGSLELCEEAELLGEWEVVP